MDNPFKQFQDIGNETVNLINSKTPEQKALHVKQLLEKFPNMDPLLLFLLD